MSLPTVPGRVDAPTTAIDLGQKMPSSLELFIPLDMRKNSSCF